MPRQARSVYAGEYYHIIVRGNNRVWLFETAANKLHFLSLLQKYGAQYNVAVHHYCVMDNHVHLLMKPAAVGEDLGKVMQGVQIVFAKSYKKQRKMTGGIFEGRYKSFHIDSDQYLLECGRYIERNPVRAGIVPDVKDYSWSSFGFYGTGSEDKLISTNPAYLSLAKSPGERRQIYYDYVNQERVYEKIVDYYFERVAVT